VDMRSDRRRSQGNLKELPALLVRDGDEIALADHAWFFRPDPVGNEAAVVPGFTVIGALMTEQVVRRKLACQVKEVLGHASPTGSEPGCSDQSSANRSRQITLSRDSNFRSTIAGRHAGGVSDSVPRRFAGRKQLITLPLIRPPPPPCVFSLDRF
jgi:hypothetical protein